ncbi:MAG: LexA family protein [Oscillospiraceae bacterium]
MGSIYENIKSRRQALGLSQEELAKKMGYTSRSTIAKIESGENDITQSKIEAFAKALETTPAWLMGWTTSPEPKLPANAIQYMPTHQIPVLGTISAGLPLYAEEHVEGYMYTELNGGAEYFGLRVSGDSMNAANIPDGSVVIIKRQSVVENGEIAAVLVNGEDATIKKFYRSGDTVTLVPHSYNPEHQPQMYNLKTMPITVLGTVVQIVISVH